MDFSAIFANFWYLIKGAYPQGSVGGALLTLFIALAAAIGASGLGIIVGVALNISRGSSRLVLIAVLGLLRAIPVIMLIFWSYFLLPILFGIEIPAVASVIFALAFIYAAYIAYAVNSGILALGQGQWSAGYALGLKKHQIMRSIILPQALRIMLPSFINQWISLIKDTSLAYIVGVSELTYLASQVNGDSYGVYAVEVFIFTGFIYFIFCSLLDLIANGAGRYFSPHSKTAQGRSE